MIKKLCILMLSVIVVCISFFIYCTTGSIIRQFDRISFTIIQWYGTFCLLFVVWSALSVIISMYSIRFRKIYSEKTVLGSIVDRLLKIAGI